MARLPTVTLGGSIEEDARALGDALRDRGACRIDGWPAMCELRALRADLLRVSASGGLIGASVGRGGSRRTHDALRGDATCWLDDPRCGEPARTFLADLGALRVGLNRGLYLGLSEVEAHYAAYPPGRGYVRHQDRFRDSDARVVSWVTYLNEDWGGNDGGALRLHLDDGAVDVAPHGGSVCFLSELEHEVLPAARERLSIAAWFRRRSGVA